MFLNKKGLTNHRLSVLFVKATCHKLCTFPALDMIKGNVFY